MLDRGRRERIRAERERHDPPARGEEDEPGRRDQWPRPAQEMQAEHVDGDDGGQAEERGDEQEHDDLVRQRLSFLHRRLKALLEQGRAGAAKAYGARHRTDEDHRKKHPRAPPVEIAGRQEEQDTEDGHVAEDPDDQLEDGVTPTLRATQDLEHSEDELLGRATPGPRAHETRLPRRASTSVNNPSKKASM